MASGEVPAQSLHGPDVRVVLTTDRDGDCLLEITQREPAPGPWRLEVVWQPVDARGLALGFTNPLYHTPLTFSHVANFAPQAFVRLPQNISYELARQCYFRVVKEEG
jgi:hypothetical protein